ncbi:cystatin-B-like [Engraulis encrasicolus]|uniref:cystatin-B-like n=1 Tax=Engraulis encrasicolus TaxID=184585 RepID=UPI002FD2C586
MAGGLGNVQDVTADIEAFCKEVKSTVEKHANKAYDVYTPKAFREQVVAGSNYFVKVHVGGEEYIHLRLFQDLPCNGGKREVHSLATNKTAADEILYF